MHDREWKRILNEISSARNLSYKNVIDKIKEELAQEHIDVYKGWKIKKFDINHLFPLRSGYINNACTLLHIAARSGHTEVIETLLKNGAKINAVDDKYGMTSLHEAAKNDHTGVVEVLLAEDAYVNAVDKCGITPLHIAAGSGHIEIVRTLLKEGANPFLKNKNGQTSRDLALNDNIKQLLKMVERKQYLNSIIMSVAIGYSVAALQATLVIAASQRFDIVIPIELIAFAIAVIALASGIVAYATLKPSAQVSEVQVVEVRDNQHNSEVLMI